MEEAESLTLQLTSEQRLAIQSLFQQKGWLLSKEDSGIDKPVKSDGTEQSSAESVEDEDGERQQEPVPTDGVSQEDTSSLEQDNNTSMEVDEKTSDISALNNDLFVEILETSTVQDISVEASKEVSQVVLDVNYKPGSVFGLSSVEDESSPAQDSVPAIKSDKRQTRQSGASAINHTKKDLNTPKRNQKSSRKSMEGKDDDDGHEFLHALEIERKVSGSKTTQGEDVEDISLKEANRSPVRQSGRKQTATKKVLEQLKNKIKTVYTPKKASPRKVTPARSKSKKNAVSNGVGRKQTAAKKVQEQLKIKIPTPTKNVDTPKKKASPGKATPVRSKSKKNAVSVEDGDQVSDVKAVIQQYIVSRNEDGEYPCFVCEKIFARAAKLRLHLKVHNIDLGSDWKEAVRDIKLEVTDDVDDVAAGSNDEELMETAEGESSDDTGSPDLIVEQREGAKMYCCPVKGCGAMFVKFASYKHHQKVHPLPFRCKKCTKCFARRSELSQHVKMHSARKEDTKQEALGSDERPFVCIVCNKGFKQAAHLQGHESIHDGIKNEECPRCGRKFRLKKNLQRHVENVNCIKKESTFTCQECNAEFPKMSSLDRHMLRHQTERPFSCSICSKAFKGKHQLLIHEKLHTGDRPFECSTCGKTFKTKRNLQDHERLHTGIKDKQCPSCGKTFALDSQLQNHINRNACGTDHIIKETGRPVFACEVCFKVFGNKQFLEYHQRSHKDERPFKCTVCGKGFKSEQNCKVHERIHTGERPFICSECGKSYRTKHNLLEHEGIHSGIKNEQCTTCGKRFRLLKNLQIHEARKSCGVVLEDIPCEICGKTFSSMMAYKRHMTEHTAVKGFTCDTCGKSFVAKASLKNHMHVHTGERPYRCDLCPKAYRKKHHLRDHLETHTNKREYSCDTCEKTFMHIRGLSSHQQRGCPGLVAEVACGVCNVVFMNPAGLKSHMRSAHQDKLFACQECGKKFALKINLQTHYRIHTGEKPFSCKMCDRKFRQLHHLQDHEKIHSGERKYTCDICDNSFPYRSSLRKHKQLHEAKKEDKQFQCKLCQHRFRTPGSLAIHMHAHDQHGKKVGYVCENCGMFFKKQSTLARHKYFETNPEFLARKRYACPKCHKRFNKPITKDYHLIQHYYPKPMVCIGCNKRFYSPSALKKHAVKCPLHPPVSGGKKQVPLTCFFCRNTFQCPKTFLGHLAEHEDMKKLMDNVGDHDFEDDEDSIDNNETRVNDDVRDGDEAANTSTSTPVARSQKKKTYRFNNQSSIIIEHLDEVAVEKTFKDMHPVKHSVTAVKGSSGSYVVKKAQTTVSGNRTVVLQNVPKATSLRNRTTEPVSVTSNDGSTYRVEVVPTSSQVEQDQQTYDIDVSSVLQNISTNTSTDQMVTVYPHNTEEMEQAIAQIQAQPGNQTVILVVDDGRGQHTILS